MAPTHNKVVYKPDSMSTEEYIVILQDVDLANKWIAGAPLTDYTLSPLCFAFTLRAPSTDRTIPLVDIVDAFDVFTTGQGAQGILERPSKQVLDTVFSTTKEDEIVQIILEKGRILSGHAPPKFGSKNDTRSGNYQSSAGSSGHGGR
ncbi:SBDS family protein [Sporobolomyces koalae]|uniref:SBDS family protein n=1 Tax=Sporobolomyces koalae TaxID=500713 RepID=UPI00316D2FF1